MQATRGVIALAVAALAVVCLGALTITSQRTELLVSSYNGRAAPARPPPTPPRAAALLSLLPCPARVTGPEKEKSVA
jgi:hypothetical protein